MMAWPPLARAARSRMSGSFAARMRTFHHSMYAFACLGGRLPLNPFALLALRIIGVPGFDLAAVRRRAPRRSRRLPLLTTPGRGAGRRFIGRPHVTGRAHAVHAWGCWPGACAIIASGRCLLATLPKKPRN